MRGQTGADPLSARVVRFQRAGHGCEGSSPEAVARSASRLLRRWDCGGERLERGRRIRRPSPTPSGRGIRTAIRRRDAVRNPSRRRGPSLPP
jgi:hypothetical protein